MNNVSVLCIGGVESQRRGACAGFGLRGEGRLLQALLKEKQFTEIIGMDVSHRALEIARDRLHFDRLPPMQKARLRLLHGSLIYRDQRLAGFDAAAVVEVIEHPDAPRLYALPSSGCCSNAQNRRTLSSHVTPNSKNDNS